jgi:hypothetical protein
MISYTKHFFGHSHSATATLGIEAAAVVKLGHGIGERIITASLHPETFPVLPNAAPTYAVVACQQLMLSSHASHSRFPRIDGTCWYGGAAPRFPRSVRPGLHRISLHVFL